MQLFNTDFHFCNQLPIVHTFVEHLCLIVSHIRARCYISFYYFVFCLASRNGHTVRRWNQGTGLMEFRHQPSTVLITVHSEHECGLKPTHLWLHLTVKEIATVCENVNMQNSVTLCVSLVQCSLQLGKVCFQQKS